MSGDTEDRRPSDEHPTVDRRGFIAGTAAGLLSLSAPAGLWAKGHDPVHVRAGRAPHRKQRAYEVRRRAAVRELQAPEQPHPTNGDLERYSNRIGSYSKGLPHDSLGEVDPKAFDALRTALAAGTFAAFERVPLGGTAKLVDPLAAYAFDLEGADSHRLGVVAPPAFASAAQAAELAELYWQALTRDAPFSDYETDPVVARAAADLSGFSAFDGPRSGGRVTASTLFRGASAGDLVGPYISQFLLKDVPLGALTVTQRCRVPISGDDFASDPGECGRVSSGLAPSRPLVYDPVPRHIRNGRDLAEYVHKDFTFQAFLNAAQILLAWGAPVVDPANPYARSATQSGFVTFGGPHVLDLVARVANLGLKAAWYQKWLVHLRARPEAFAMHVHSHVTGLAEYPIHQELLDSQALSAMHDWKGTYLLPTTYPEGCPLHPAYPAGHAVIAGACVLVLKAFFDERAPVPQPVVSTPDGLALAPYDGAALTVGAELDKLASNVAIGRDTAGIHWRSDGVEGIRLGEAVARTVLRDFRDTYAEEFDGWTVTTYDGETLTV